MTDTMIRWDPLFPVTLSIAVAIAVLVLLVAVELRRKQKYLFVRVTAQCIMIACVLLLVLRPSLATDAKSNSVLLVTEGVPAIDSLKKISTVVDVKNLASLNEVSTLHVHAIAGNGLPSWALDLLPNKNYKFIPSPATEGISGINIPDHVYAHRWNEINGSYNLTRQSATIKLRGPGGVEDSVKLEGPGDVPFSLSYFAKAPGRFNYELVTPAGSETLPLVIEPERNLSILFIADYPTFETRYLKNFLASKGHRLAIRNQVSRGQYKLEFANRPAVNFQSLTAAVLKEADLLVIDESSWHTLNSAEQKNLITAVQDGLGVVVLSGSKRKSSLMQFTPTSDKDTASVSVHRAGSFILPVLPLEVKQSTPLLTSSTRVLSGYKHNGAGKVGYQLLNETYQVALQGKAEAYSSLWAPLLEKCARSDKQDFKLRVTSPFPYYENQPVAFDIISSGKEPHLTYAETPVPLSEDEWVDDLWHGKIWLEGGTWHELKLDSASHWVPLAKKNSWKTLDAINNSKATALAASGNANNESTSTTYDDNVLRIILFTLFIISAGFTWLAPKL